MANRAVKWAFGLGVVGVFVLGCGGMGGGDGKEGASGPNADLRVADSKLKKGGKRAKSPSTKIQAATYKKNEYTVKLRPGKGRSISKIIIGVFIQCFFVNNDFIRW